MKLKFAPLAIAVVALCCSSVEVFAESSNWLVVNGGGLSGSEVLSRPEVVKPAQGILPEVFQRTARVRTMIRYGFDLASGHTGDAANSALVSLRGGLTSVSRKAAAAGVELTVVW